MKQLLILIALIFVGPFSQADSFGENVCLQGPTYFQLDAATLVAFRDNGSRFQVLDAAREQVFEALNPLNMKRVAIQVEENSQIEIEKRDGYWMLNFWNGEFSSAQPLSCSHH